MFVSEKRVWLDSGPQSPGVQTPDGAATSPVAGEDARNHGQAQLTHVLEVMPTSGYGGIVFHGVWEGGPIESGECGETLPRNSIATDAAACWEHESCHILSWPIPSMTFLSQ
jgi:hypothetical protein